MPIQVPLKPKPIANRMLMKYRIRTKCRRFINVDMNGYHFQQIGRQMGMATILLVVTALIFYAASTEVTEGDTSCLCSFVEYYGVLNINSNPRVFLGNLSRVIRFL